MERATTLPVPPFALLGAETAHDSNTPDGAAGSVSRPPSTARLIAAVARRDREAYRRLFAAYAPRIRRFLSGRGTLEAVAEEVAQEVMLKVWSKASVAVLRAAYIDGLSMREIAEHHSLPLGTVKTRARNALARLRCLLW